MANGTQFPRSFKKLVAKNIFDQKLLKKYKKANKLNLKNKGKLNRASLLL